MIYTMGKNLKYTGQEAVTISACQILPSTSFDVSENLRVLYVVEGEVSIQFTSGAKRLSRDAVEIIGINEPVRLFSQTDNTVLLFTVDGEFAKSRCERIDRMILNCSFDFIFPSQVDEEKLDSLRALLREVLSDYMSAAPSLNSTVERLLQLLVEHFDSYNNVLNHIPNEDLHKARFNSINTYIIDNLNDKIRLSDLVDQEHVSSQYLSKEFKKKYGISFSELLSYYRIIHSVRLLTNTRLSLSEVSEQCGFSAVRYYYKYFKRFLGVSPSEFRKRITERTGDPLAFVEVDLDKVWEMFRCRTRQLLWLLPPIKESARLLLLHRASETPLGGRMNSVSLVVGEDWEAKGMKQLLEITPELDGIVLVGMKPSLARQLRQELPVPVVDLYEAAESSFHLSGIPFERLKACAEREVSPDICAGGIMPGVRQHELQGGQSGVLLLEDMELLPDLRGLEEKYAQPVTDGINEGMLMIDALLGEEGIRQRNRLTPH